MKQIITDKQPTVNGLKCEVCGAALAGRQRKYCSSKCRIHALSSYPSQKARGYARKKELIAMLGGKCSMCGYDKYLSALEFHHIDKSTKSFNLDSRSLSNRTFDVCVAESQKCVLLCANCHREVHNAYGQELLSPLL